MELLPIRHSYFKAKEGVKWPGWLIPKHLFQEVGLDYQKDYWLGSERFQLRPIRIVGSKTGIAFGRNWGGFFFSQIWRPKGPQGPGLPIRKEGFIPDWKEAKIQGGVPWGFPGSMGKGFYSNFSGDSLNIPLGGRPFYEEFLLIYPRFYLTNGVGYLKFGNQKTPQFRKILVPSSQFP